MNKYILFFMLTLMLAGVVNATIYYVNCSGGSDNNDGLTASTAWHNISKINGESFNAGDKILFAREENFNDSQLQFPSSGSHGNYIHISSYGNGGLPNITSISFYGAKNWINLSYINIKANSTKGALNIEGGKNFIVSHNVVSGFPKNGYDCITISKYLTNYGQNLTIFNNTIKNCGYSADVGCGIQISTGNKHINVFNNTLLNISEAAIQTYSYGYPYRNSDINIYYNNVVNPLSKTIYSGINIGWNSINVSVHHNFVVGGRYGITYDSNITGVGGYNRIYNNVVFNASELITIRANSYGNTTNGVIYNNFLHGGNNTVKGLWFSTSNNNHGYNMSCYNNLIIGNSSTSYFLPELRISGNMSVTSDYNVFYDYSGSVKFERNNSAQSSYNITGWIAATDYDTNSYQKNPLFYGDFIPQDDSVCYGSNETSYIGAYSCNNNGIINQVSCKQSTTINPNIINASKTLVSYYCSYDSSTLTYTLDCEGTGEINVTNLNQLGKYYRIVQDGIEIDSKASDDTYSITSCSTWRFIGIGTDEAYINDQSIESLDVVVAQFALIGLIVMLIVIVALITGVVTGHLDVRVLKYIGLIALIIVIAGTIILATIIALNKMI